MANTMCETEDTLFKTAPEGWGTTAPACNDKFIRVHSIEKFDLSYNVTFNKTDADKMPKLSNLGVILDTEDPEKIVIEVGNTILNIPFYTRVQFETYTPEELLKVKYSAYNKGKFWISVPSDLRVKYDPELKNIEKDKLEIAEKKTKINDTTSVEYNKLVNTYTEREKEYTGRKKKLSDSKIYESLVVYLLKADLDNLKPETTAGGRKSRRTINRKRRDVRKRRNTKRHSKTYRR